MCDLVVENKGSYQVINDLINKICLQILKDKLTEKILDELKEKELLEKINALECYSHENPDHESLINIVIKVQVYNEMVLNNQRLFKHSIISKKIFKIIFFE